MKKIFTLLMAMVVTLSMLAVTPNLSGKKADPTGRATELANKELKHHKQVAKVLGMDKVERQAKPATKTAPIANTQQEEITLNYDAFAGMRYYEEEEQSAYMFIVEFLHKGGSNLGLVHIIKSCHCLFPP